MNWIKFDSDYSSVCPVDGETVVEIRLKENTFPIKPMPAKEFYWNLNRDLPVAIVEYRIIEEESERSEP